MDYNETLNALEALLKEMQLDIRAQDIYPKPVNDTLCNFIPRNTPHQWKRDYARN